MLTKDIEERATLEDIVHSPWVTNDGKQQIELQQFEEENCNEKGKSFGNISRLLKMKCSFSEHNSEPANEGDIE